MWICPHCRQQLRWSEDRRSLACPEGHQFDRAREGYVNLLPANRKRSKEPGDDRAMLAARRRALDAGFYQPLADGVEALLAQITGIERVVDLGCGEGFYTAAVAGAFPAASVYGIDIAKEAVRLAAKRHEMIDFAVASAFDVPLAAGSIDLVTSIFAPVSATELQRLTAVGGYYLKVVPGPQHLWSLRQALYTNPRPHTAEPVSEQGFNTLDTRTFEYQVTLDGERLADLVAMTPFAHRGHREKRDALLAGPSITLEMAFEMAILQRTGDVQINR
ncbi:MAG: putative RNA methyltransferase [Halieaceae bacterium]